MLLISAENLGIRRFTPSAYPINSSWSRSTREAAMVSSTEPPLSADGDNSSWLDPPACAWRATPSPDRPPARRLDLPLYPQGPRRRLFAQKSVPAGTTLQPQP